MRITATSLKAALVSRLSKGRRVGVTIGAQRVYVTLLANGGSRENSFSPWSASLGHSLLDATTDLEDTIKAALQDCPHLGRANPAAVNVVLLPPLALGRRILLPRLSEAEYRQVLARDSFRYFPTDRSPRVVGALRLPTRQSSPVPIFATSASARLIDAVQKAITAVGCEIESLDCAYASWVGAATSMWPSIARSKSAIIVCQDDVTEVIHIDGARPEMVRRVGANAPFDQVLHAIGMYSKGGPPRTCAILGSAERYNEWGAELSGAGIAVLPSTPTSTIDGGTLSAMYGAVGAGPGLYPEGMYAASRAGSQRLARQLGGIAAALVIIAAVLVLWGAKRELRATVGERAAIRSEVARALALRSDIGGLDARAAMIATLRSSTPHWSSVISSVARALPADAHLTSIQAHADTIVLEGVATRAGGVFEALQRDPDITTVHSNAPVRQQLQDGTPVEHFGVAARLAPPSAQEQ